MHFNKLYLLAVVFFVCCNDQKSKATTALVTKQDAIRKDTTPINNRLISKALTHLSKPYLAHTLDSSNIEQLTVRMDGFDCTTLVETVLAEAKAETNIEDHILKTRYRNGILLDYASRIHYFTEWIYENQKNGIVQDITADFSCSKPFKHEINFMSKHRNKYHQLKQDTIFAKIKKMEEAINKYQWRYIPKQKLAACEAAIQHGDIIAITSNVIGLDIAHLGFAYRQSDKLYLLHASTDEKKVVITKKTLVQYLMSHIKQTGIMVVRVKNESH